jgi:PAS domain S-box-containing protein
MNSKDPLIPERQASPAGNSGQALACDEGKIKNKNQEPSLPGQATRIEQAEARTEQAETRTEQAETRTEQAEARTEQAKTRTEQAEARTEQAEARTEQVKTRTEQAEMRSEQAIRTSDFNYRRLFEAAKEGILILEADTGRISDVNPFLIEMLGYSHGELVGKPIWELGPFRDIVSNKAKFEQLHQQGYVLYENLSLETREGGKIAVEFVSNVYQAGDRNVIQCNVRDITERKRAEETARRMREMEEQKRLAMEANRMKSEFLANMSHELRTPLSNIIGFSEFLKEGKPGQLNPKQGEYVNDILNSGRHLLQLINDILDLSKVEAGKMELHPEMFEVKKVIEEVCSISMPMAQKRNISIRREVDTAINEVTLDVRKFKQVIFNLLSNAIRFSDDGGSVEISVRPHDATALRVQVKDTGVGIKAEDLGKLFAEFQQLDSGPARRHEGTGLGLSLTKKIVEFQNGNITVASEPGKGSTFTVILPLRPF